jgi:hypothetical protein
MQFGAKTHADFSMNGTEYAADSVLGGPVDVSGWVGSKATYTVDASSEDYWPRIPTSYGPSPAHLENAVEAG